MLHDRDPAKAIARYAGHRDTMVVMGTHGRSGLRSVVMGSTALGVARQATCPVVVVPPRAATPIAS